MKIPAKDIESFINVPSPSIRAVLIYGPDNGLTVERANKLTKVVNKNSQDDPFSIVEMSFDKYKEDPAILGDEMASISLMGGQKIIIVKDVNPAITKEMKYIITELPGDGFVIITAGDLTPKSTLRQCFEKQKNIAAIACYKDEGMAVRTLIDAMLSDNQKTCDNQALQYMQHYIVGDRLIIRNEINKLITYIGDKAHITLDDVMAIISNNSESSLDEFCNAVATGNILATEKIIKILEQEGLNSHVTLRALQRYLLRLHFVKALAENGESEQLAMKQLRPPVFFKQVDTFKRNLRAHSLTKITKMLKILVKAEQSTKTHSSASETIHRQAVSILTRQSAR